MRQWGSLRVAPRAVWSGYVPAVRRRTGHAVVSVLTLLGVALLPASGCSTQHLMDTSVRRPKVTFFDDFLGAAGMVPASSRWNYDVGGTGWGNNELQYYTNDPRNAVLDGQGHLVISALRDTSSHWCWYGACRFTSARLTTYQKFSQTYGRFEARIQLPKGTGIWPAFWLLDDDVNKNQRVDSGGEIDVMEFLGHEPTTIYGSLHGPGYDASASYHLARSSSFSDGFHLVAVDWTQCSVTFSVDGNVYETRRRADVGHGWVFDHPFYLLLNVAVGGDWPGPPDDGTEFPARLIVDYVRVYAAPRTHALGCS